MDLSTYRAIVEQASRQLDLLTRAQLHGNGLSNDAIVRARNAGFLVAVGRRTFALAGARDSFERRVMAACLDTGGVASHRTAAALHGLKGFGRTAEVEVTVVHHRRHSGSRIARVHGTTNLPVDDLVRIGPIPATGIARTFLGLAALVPDVSSAAIGDAVADAAREDRVSDAWLWWRLEELRCRGRNGVRAMEAILRRRQQLGPTESWLERRFLELLEEAGLPLPAVQRRIQACGAFVGRVDTLYDAQRLVIEIEGHAHHNTREQRDSDERRRTRLILAGFEVIVFTYSHLVHDPARVVDDVRAMLALRLAL